MKRKKASPPKPRIKRKRPDPEKVKEVLRDAELKKFDPELAEIIERQESK